MKKVTLALFILFATGTALSQKSDYFNAIKDAAERGWKDNPQIVEEWKKTTFLYSRVTFLQETSRMGDGTDGMRTMNENPKKDSPAMARITLPIHPFLRT